MEELASNPFYSALFVAVGLALLFLEVFVPSAGVLGVLAFVCSAFGVYGFFHQGHSFLGIGTILGIFIFGFYAVRFGLRRTKLDVSLESAAYTSVDEDIADLIGQVGTTHSELRPAGTALLGGKKVDVVSPGYFIPRGVEVRVIDTAGNRVVVTEFKKEEESPGESTVD